MLQSVKINSRDRSIAAQLQIDCRQSLARLSEKLNMRPSTVHERIARMEKEGVIEGYKAILCAEKIGAQVAAFMLVSGKPSFHLDKPFLDDQRIMEVWGVTGKHDILIKARFRDTDEFSRFVLDFRKRYGDQVKDTETFLATVRIKETCEKPIQLFEDRG